MSASSRVRSLPAWALAVGAFLLTRLPFVFHNPDWAGFDDEHCFFLSLPVVHHGAERLSGEELAFWAPDPGLLRFHYHRGASWIAWLTDSVIGATNWRSLALLKLIAIAHGVVAIVVLTRALRRAFPSDDARWLAPLLVLLLPPSLFLWSTLLPMGHYTETWVFHALLLGLAVPVLDGRGRWWHALLAGGLAGAAIAYTVSNGVLAIGFLMVLLLATPGWGRRLGLAGIFLAAAAPLPAMVGTLDTIQGRLAMEAPPTVGPPPNFLVRLVQNAGNIVHPEVVLRGDEFALRGLFQVSATDGWAPATLQAAVAWLLTLGCALGSLLLAWHGARLLWPGTRARQSLGERVMGLNGIWLGGGFVTYLLMFAGSGRTAYFLPLMATLLFGLAQVGVSLARLPGRAGRGVRGVVVGVVVLLALGWVDELRHNARDPGRPDLQRCDSTTIGNWSRILVGSLPQQPQGRVDRARMCSESFPGDEASCDLWSFAYTVNDGAYIWMNQSQVDCAQLQGEDRSLCWRAYGAGRWSTGGCPAPPEERACAGLDPADRWACVSGAHQGYGDLVGLCRESFLQACQQSFPEPGGQESCWEEAASLLESAPLLPPPPASPSARCGSWPEGWQGLCARLEQRLAEEGDGRSCEAFYFAELADEIPEQESLAWERCLILDRERYRYCAVGLARQREQTDCRW